MKNLLVTLAIMLVALPALNAANFSSADYKLIGFNMYNAHSASNYGGSLNLNLSIERDKRHLEAGIIMQLESARISGGEILYRHYLSPVYTRENAWFGQYRDFRFYFQYNILYRTQMLSGNSDLTTFTMQEKAAPGRRVSTAEHYAGIGALIRVYNNVFVNTSMGYGVIMGSVDDKHSPDKAINSVSRYKCDFGLAAKFGLSYFFRK